MTTFERFNVGRWGAVVSMVTALAWTATAWAAETDDSRLGAQQVELGASTQDALTPPDDSVDWLYFELEAESSVSIELTRRDGDGALRMTLSKATGEDVDRIDAPGGEASLDLTLAPGLYYIKLTADAAAEYMLALSERKKPPSLYNTKGGR